MWLHGAEAGDPQALHERVLSQALSVFQPVNMGRSCSDSVLLRQPGNIFMEPDVV